MFPWSSLFKYAEIPYKSDRHPHKEERKIRNFHTYHNIKEDITVSSKGINNSIQQFTNILHHYPKDHSIYTANILTLSKCA